MRRVAGKTQEEEKMKKNARFFEAV